MNIVEWNFKNAYTINKKYDVIVGEGAVIKNSIIFSGSVIDPGSVLENVIMDKHARVKNMKNLKGELKEPLFIKEGDVV